MKSSNCPNCGSPYPWLNLEYIFKKYPWIEFQDVFIRLKRVGDKPYIPLSRGDYRWMCEKCFHIWIDSEFKEDDECP